ncbi:MULTISPECIES: hypothetical protein [Citrobacter]|uniref:Uncharacterized protein n=1 Tax=Citrobacter braakii TaxID=57706 RepID=A0ABR6TUW1_CITBR|nr:MULTISPECIES: hypothetical protein [Citrobacter]MBC2610114.1 hypothetical protein [Citrobacter braakii]MBC2634154.1 hypothetical protein [Citrobacter braakii]MBC2646873.1 hypothetical protein [Citrobacter braakii]MDM3430914.1 hypothetical protein [Citrobacter sp. Cb023]MDM3437578.1 hypothetical protein [Citrobacter sp. Cb034]
MTTLIAWVGVDSQRIGSVYIASDSRITWMDYGDCWDSTQKVFSSRFYPEIFGYSGRAEIAVHTLQQLIGHIDDDILIEHSDSFELKIQKVILFLNEKVSNLSGNRIGAGTIIYATRIGFKMKSQFHIAEIKFSKNGFVWSEIELPNESNVVAKAGSGAAIQETINNKWCIGDKLVSDKNEGYIKKNYSRFVFSSLCEAILSKSDKYTGGAPQLVGLYKHKPGLNFGVIFNSKRYLSGKEISCSQAKSTNVEWRNEFFELCDGESMQVLDGAQKQPRC